MEKTWNSSEPFPETTEPRTTSKDPQASLASVKVSVHGSTIRKRLGKIGIMGEFQGENHCWPKRTKAHLSHIFQKTLDDPKDPRQKLNFLKGVHPVTSDVRLTQHFIKNNIIPTVIHGGVSVMVWGCFAASEPGRLAVIDGTMNSALYQKILKENVQPSVRDLRLKHTWVT